MKAAILSALAAALSGPSWAGMPAAAARQPKPLWTIDGLSQPESALYDEKTDAVYISNVNGDPGAKDGNGFIAKAGLNGKIEKKNWIKGLNAPKGLGACGGKLYVADIDEIVVIDIASAKVQRKIALPQAKMLNDVALEAGCAGFVSDTLGSGIYRFEAGGQAVEWARSQDLHSPNGLSLGGGKLNVAAWGLSTDWSTTAPGRLLAVDLKTRAREPLPGPQGNLDGLKKTSRGWLVTDWAGGTLLLVAPNGQSKVLINGLRGPADLDYVAAKDLLLLPRMQEGMLSAYRLSEIAK